MQITRFNHVAYNTHGVTQQAREFYTKLLGLPEVPVQLPGMTADAVAKTGIAWVQLGPVQMHLIPLPAKGEPREPFGTHVSWYVADLEGACAELAANKIEMRVLGEGRTRIVWISDPAGNTVELQQDPER